MIKWQRSCVACLGTLENSCSNNSRTVLACPAAKFAPFWTLWARSLYQIFSRTWKFTYRVSRPLSFDVNHGISWSWCILFFHYLKRSVRLKSRFYSSPTVTCCEATFDHWISLYCDSGARRLCLRYICPAGNFSQPLLARSQTISLALSKMIRNNNNHRFGQNQASVCLELWKFGIRTRLKIDIKLAANIIETTKCVHIYIRAWVRFFSFKVVFTICVKVAC